MSPILKPYLAKDNAERIPVGCSIDDILSGGIETKVITQLYGPAGSGKTNVCLQLAVNCVRSGKKVVFIDTEAGHSFERLKQIAGSDSERVLKNIYVYEPHNFEEQNFIVENLEHVVNENFGMIVLDSAVSLYRLHSEEEKVTSANRQLSRQFAKLSELAAKHNLAVIVTNQVYSSIEDGEVEPIGGSILKYWSKAIIELRKDSANVREAILRRHRSLPEDMRCKFVIASEGLRDAR